MVFNRAMKTTAITGSASGIGAALRTRLEAAGDRVIGVDLHDAEIQADLSTAAGRQHAIVALREAASDGLDRLVLAAGLGPHIDDLEMIASVNYFGAVELLDGLKDSLAGRSEAAIVAIASNSAQMVSLDEHPYVEALLAGDEKIARERVAKENGFLAYAGSKHALSRAVRRRAAEWAEAGIRLNAIAPGPTRTPLLEAGVDHPVFGKGLRDLKVPMGRWAEPEEIADWIELLLSPRASFVHGSVIYVDGGVDAAWRPDRF